VSKITAFIAPYTKKISNGDYRKIFTTLGKTQLFSDKNVAKL